MGSRKSPGRAYRKGISLVEALHRFGDDEKAEAWFVDRRWPDGVRCTGCEGENVTATNKPRKTTVYRCQDCKTEFTVKTGTIMHDSRLSLGKWAMAFYLFTTNLKGVSAMKLRRDLGISYKSAWHMAHRIREAWDDGTEQFDGPVEVDETYIGGKELIKHASKRKKVGGGVSGKAAVVGMRDQNTGRIQARYTAFADSRTLKRFIDDRTEDTVVVYTDEATVYKSLHQHRSHWTVRHTAGEYVKRQATTNGIESFWALLKRGIHGTYHHVSVKHLGRYVAEFTERHNQRPLDTEEQMNRMAEGIVGKRLTYRELVGVETTPKTEGS